MLVLFGLIPEIPCLTDFYIVPLELMTSIHLLIPLSPILNVSLGDASTAPCTSTILEIILGSLLPDSEAA